MILDIARDMAELVARGPVTPAAAQAFIEQQLDTWAKVVKANNITAD